MPDPGYDTLAMKPAEQMSIEEADMDVKPSVSRGGASDNDLREMQRMGKTQELRASDATYRADGIFTDGLSSAQLQAGRHPGFRDHLAGDGE